MQSSAQGAQASPHVSSLEDRQIIQISIDNETNGREFEFAEEILATEIRIKGFAFYCSNTDGLMHRSARGCIELQIDWLKTVNVRLSVPGPAFEGSSLIFPWDLRGEGLQNTTYDYGMDLPISLPSQTSMRKRFKATVNYCHPTLGVTKMPVHFNDIFRLVITLEVVHDHIFR